MKYTIISPGAEALLHTLICPLVDSVDLDI